MSRSAAAKPAVDTANIETEKLAALLRGAPDTSVTVAFGASADKESAERRTFTLVRTKLAALNSGVELEGAAGSLPTPKVTSLGGGDGFVRSERNDPPQPNRFNSGVGALPVDDNRKIVRVYALRGILGGDTKDYGEKERACEELIAHALDKAGLGGGKDRPDISFHMKSRALLVKATAAQQEIILQIIEAMKENETQPVQKTGTVKDNNTLRLQNFDDLKEKPLEPTAEVIKPDKLPR